MAAFYLRICCSKGKEAIILKIAKALLDRAKAVLEKAADKDTFIAVEGTAMTICPREKQPDKDFDTYGFFDSNGRTYAIGAFHRKKQTPN